MVLCGGAGHSKEIVKRLSKDGILIGIDRDMAAINTAKERLSQFSNIKYVNDNHDNIKNILDVIKQYNGKIDYLVTDKTFQVEIILENSNNCRM